MEVNPKVWERGSVEGENGEHKSLVQRISNQYSEKWKWRKQIIKKERNKEVRNQNKQRREERELIKENNLKQKDEHV